MFDMKVKTVLLTSHMPALMDEMIRKAVPENANVFNYIFGSHDGHYYCHIIYSEKANGTVGYYADCQLMESYCNKECEK